jgi:hypothetical protein
MPPIPDHFARRAFFRRFTVLTNRYMTSVKNVGDILKRIREGTAPDKFTVAHLKSIGFKSSSDQGIIPVLKALGFLTDDGKPTKRYLDYRDSSRARVVMAEALREAYGELFHIKEKLAEADRPAVIGKLKSTHNVGDRVAEQQAMTFFALLKHADLDAVPGTPGPTQREKAEEPAPPPEERGGERVRVEHAHLGGLHYNIQVHLPATKDIEVFNAIFKSLKEHLLG